MLRLRPTTPLLVLTAISVGLSGLILAQTDAVTARGVGTAFRRNALPSRRRLFSMWRA